MMKDFFEELKRYAIASPRRRSIIDIHLNKCLEKSRYERLFIIRSQFIVLD